MAIHAKTTRLLAITFAASLAACADPGEVATGDDYLEPVPSTSQLALTMDDAAEDEAEARDGSKVLEVTAKVLEEVNAAVAATQDRLHALAAEVEPETATIGGAECKRWTKAGEAVEWRLTSCKQDRFARKVAFKLEGRTDGEFLVVAAGHGTRLPRFDGLKRGHGRIGYNLDNRYALVGEGATGKVGIGFRATGALRVLNVGLRDFARPGEDAVTAAYSYRHLLGTGGQVTLRAHADLVTTDADGAIVRGTDDLVETGRLVVAWKRGEGAKATITVCGGTVGEGECVQLSQRWSRDLDEAPAADADGEIPGPAMDEPAAE